MPWRQPHEQPLSLEPELRPKVTSTLEEFISQAHRFPQPLQPAITAPLGLIDDVVKINLLCSWDERGILYGKTLLDFKAFLCKWILEPHVKSNKSAAFCLARIRPGASRKEGADEEKADLLRYCYEVWSLTYFTEVVSVQLHIHALGSCCFFLENEGGGAISVQKVQCFHNLHSQCAHIYVTVYHWCVPHVDLTWLLVQINPLLLCYQKIVM